MLNKIKLIDSSEDEMNNFGSNQFSVVFDASTANGNTNYVHNKNYIDNISFSNVVAGSGEFEIDINTPGNIINWHSFIAYADAPYPEKEYYCYNDNNDNLCTGNASLLKLPDRNNNKTATVYLDSSNEYNCSDTFYYIIDGTQQPINSEICGSNDESVWLKEFYVMNVYDHEKLLTEQVFGTTKDAPWYELYPDAGTESNSLPVIQFYTSLVDGPARIVASPTNHRGELALMFIVGFDSNDNITNYKILAGQDHSGNSGEGAFNQLHALIYNVRVNYLGSNSGASEICEQFVQVGNMKWQAATSGELNFLPQNSYMNWYGRSNVPVPGLNNYSSPIQVEPLMDVNGDENDVLYTAGTPYSTSESGSGTIAMYDQCAGLGYVATDFDCKTS
ncbi:hypothetical protein CO057_01350, partial [Candidatus Uhrbacteria bacterium CG_4_9_14_0_2_um_filter_41_50]